ncbi:MAG: DNA alkylation repair protein [Muribaculaceae bacterium]|nr:DNA alkylation repair protein [Muribaculaceae bacterium]
MNKEKVTAADIEALLREQENREQREVLMRFFKTGKGQYGEGDEFLGLKVPQTRAVVKEAKGLVSLTEIEKLLYSRWHEVRLAGFLLLVEEMKRNMPKRSDKDDSKKLRRKEVAECYLRHARQANNWDLVDLSAHFVVGPYLRLDEDFNTDTIMRLAESDNLWEQRISIISTFDFIRNGNFAPTLLIADKLISHPHDLIHKAIGWMLREIGKRDLPTLLEYLQQRYMKLPRTSLRYAIERFPEPERKFWLNRPYKE